MKRLILSGLAAVAVIGSLLGAGAANADVYYKMGPLLGQSCDDPLKLANDPSAGEIVCTRYGQWVQSVNPTAVRSLGAPCPPSESGLVAKTPDDHMIMCPSGVWMLYKP
jgi:hypothetical protein